MTATTLDTVDRVIRTTVHHLHRHMGMATMGAMVTGGMVDMVHTADMARTAGMVRPRVRWGCPKGRAIQAVPSASPSTSFSPQAGNRRPERRLPEKVVVRKVAHRRAVAAEDARNSGLWYTIRRG